MPRTAAKTKVKTNPLSNYRKLALYQQKLVWLFHRGLATDNTEGLDAEESPGSLSNWKISGNIRHYIPRTSWRYQANKAAVLATQIYEAGHHELEEPYLPPKPEAKVSVGTKRKATEDDIQENDDQINNQEVVEEVQEEEDKDAVEEIEEDEEEEEDPMPKTPSRTRTPSRGTPLRKTPVSRRSSRYDDEDDDEDDFDLARHLDCLTVGQIREQPICGALNYCHLSTRWTDWNYDSNRVEGFAMMRLFLQNGTTVEDFEFSWIDKRTFEVKLVWPEFMNKVLMQTGLDVEVKKIPVKRSAAAMDDDDDDDEDAFKEVLYERFPKSHEAMKGFAKTSNRLQDHFDDNKIRSVGLFHFEHDMDTSEDSFTCKLFSVAVNKKGDTARILQIEFKEAIVEKKDAKKKAKIKEVSSGQINFCKSKSLKFAAPDPPDSPPSSLFNQKPPSKPPVPPRINPDPPTKRPPSVDTFLFKGSVQGATPPPTASPAFADPAQSASPAVAPSPKRGRTMLREPTRTLSPRRRSSSRKRVEEKAEDQDQGERAKIAKQHPLSRKLTSFLYPLQTSFSNSTDDDL